MAPALLIGGGGGGPGRGNPLIIINKDFFINQRVSGPMPPLVTGSRSNVLSSEGFTGFLGQGVIKQNVPAGQEENLEAVSWLPFFLFLVFCPPSVGPHDAYDQSSKKQHKKKEEKKASKEAWESGSRDCMQALQTFSTPPPTARPVRSGGVVRRRQAKDIVWLAVHPLCARHTLSGGKKASFVFPICLCVCRRALFCSIRTPSSS